MTKQTRKQAKRRAKKLFALAFALLFPMASLVQALPVTSGFGWRTHPITGAWKFHSGVDLGYGYGTPIPAMFDGIVVSAGNFSDGYGNQVLLYHPAYDAYTRYAHMSEVYVYPGDTLPQGATLGLVGATGNATGPHLHLEYIVSDGEGGYQYENPLDLWQ